MLEDALAVRIMDGMAGKIGIEGQPERMAPFVLAKK